VSELTMKANQKIVMFLGNGGTAVFIDDEQVAELQQPWLVKFVEFLDEQGQDPTTFKYTLSDGNNAKVFRTEFGWQWEIIPSFP
jgi:hypothetical protein